MALDERCTRCGRRAEGFAFINDDRLCHGDGPGPSCYELAQYLDNAEPAEWEVQKRVWAATRDPVENELRRISGLFDEIEARAAAQARHPSRWRERPVRGD